MIALNFTIDTQSTDTNRLAKILRAGKFVAATGIVNLHWEEFSAIEVARHLDLKEIAWEVVKDNTPGSLTITISGLEWKPSDALELLSDIEGVLEYEIYASHEINDYCA